MGIFDQLVLLVTGLVALYLVWRFFSEYRESAGRATHDLYYLVSFLVLLVAGLLLIVFSYSVLASPLVVIVAVLIPACLALGLVAEFAPSYEKPYLVFAVIGLLAIVYTRLAMPPGGVPTAVLVAVHTVAGLTILGLPLMAISGGRAPSGFVFVSVGAVLIDLGGIALAFLKTGSQLLFFSQSFVFTILAPLLLLMTLAYAWGFAKKQAMTKKQARLA